MTGTAVSTNGIFKLDLINTALKASVKADVSQGNGYIEVSGTLENLDPTNNPDRGLWLGFNLPVNTVGWNWGHNLTAANQVITSTVPGYSGDDRLLIPIPAVWSTNGGIALCIPPTDPCVFELSADAGGVRVLMALGVSPITTNFPSKAPFRFRIYSIDGTWGFRDALAKYYDWYPDYYAISPSIMKRLNYNRDWLTENYEKEGPSTNDLVALAFPAAGQYCAYTKLTARPQGMTGVENFSSTNTQGYLAAIANCTDILHYGRKVPLNDPSLIEARAAISNCVAYHPDGTWSMQADPAAGTLDIGHNVSPNLYKDAAHPNGPVYGDMYLRRPGKLLGSNTNFNFMHWDVTGGRSLIVNYRREHFPYTQHPLTFDQSGRLCLPTQFTNYELFEAFRLQLKQGGMFHEGAGMQDFGANNTKELLGGQDRVGMFFLSSQLASAWNEGGEKYHALGDYDEYRVFMGRKSYRIAWGPPASLVGFDPLATIKRALAVATAFGFACCPDPPYFYSTTHPNYDPASYSGCNGLINAPAHQALWASYIPANEAIRLAGWEPVTHAFSSSSAVEVQRFGHGQEIYLTVWGPANLPASVDIDIEAAALGLSANATFREMVSNTSLTIVPSARGWKLTVPMEQDVTRVIKITVNAAATSAPTNLTYSSNPAVYTVSSAITNNSPASSGGAVASYSVSPALPAGLTLNSTTGIISGTPTTITATASYTVTATNNIGSTTASVRIAINGNTARLSNLSARVAVGGLAGTPIPGFVLSGSGDKPMLIRAVGPTLGGLGVVGALADPRFTLFRGAASLSGNDNWSGADAAAMAATGAFALAAASKDAALIISLSASAYTAPVSATDGGNGIALLEVYEAPSNATAVLVNGSTRAYVGTGESVLIPGFVVGGSGNLRLLIRAVGPTLAAFGVTDSLADPTMTLFRGSTPLATSDNWSDASNAAEIASTARAVGAFALPTGSRDAAILTTLPPGAYTVVVSGVGATSGTALVEIYVVP
jgi:hypothetical protein